MIHNAVPNMPIVMLFVAVPLSVAASGLTPNATASVGNLAVAASVSTSYVSGHETLTAVQDGVTPRSSADTSHGAYGNWPKRGVQWVQYSWTRPVNISGVSVYWYDDGRGVRVPSAARLLRWDGRAWTEITNRDGGGLPLQKNAFNMLTFPPVTTDKLRLELTGKGESSTGVIEWTVSDAGNSPTFPPIVVGPPDRIVRPGKKTDLAATVRAASNKDLAIGWSRISGPGEVEFADPHAASTDATFVAAGNYVVRITAKQGSQTAFADLRVEARASRPLSGQSEVLTRHYMLTSPLWKARTKALIVTWLPHCIAEIDRPNLREGGIQNLIEAGKKNAGRPSRPHVGYPFSNAWVMNTVEAMCVALTRDADGDAEIANAQAAFRKKLDEWIPLILAAQEPDGYFQTRITLGYPREKDQPAAARRWQPRLRGEHEGYVAGYFIEAGIAHHLATGGKDTRLYVAAKKLADCWAEHIGPPPKQEWYDGHEEMEQALLRLAAYVDDVEGKGKGRPYADLRALPLGVSGPTWRRGIRPDSSAGRPPICGRRSCRPRGLSLLRNGPGGPHKRRRPVSQCARLGVGQPRQSQDVCDGRRGERRDERRFRPRLLAPQSGILRVVRQRGHVVLPAPDGPALRRGPLRRLVRRGPL